MGAAAAAVRLGEGKGAKEGRKKGGREGERDSTERFVSLVLNSHQLDAVKPTKRKCRIFGSHQVRYPPSIPFF